MFGQSRNRAMERIKVERRLRTVEVEIDSVAVQLSNHPGELARRLKDIATRRPAVLQSAIETNDPQELVSRVNAELGNEARVQVRLNGGEVARALLVSAVEYSWAKQARQSILS